MGSRSQHRNREIDEPDVARVAPNSEDVCDVESNTNESTPLLSGHTHQKTTPLPLGQLLLLAAVRIAEPIAFTQVRFSNVPVKTLMYPNSLQNIDLSLREPSASSG